MEDKKKLIIIIFIVIYISMINPIYKIIQLEKEKNIILREKNTLKANNINLITQRKEIFNKNKSLENKEKDPKVDAFKKVGEYLSDIDILLKNNNLKIIYMGRIKVKENKIKGSYNLKGTLYNFIGFLNEIEKTKKVFLSKENFFIEEKEKEILITINLEGYFLKKMEKRNENSETNIFCTNYTKPSCKF